MVVTFVKWQYGMKNVICVTRVLPDRIFSFRTLVTNRMVFWIKNVCVCVCRGGTYRWAKLCLLSWYLENGRNGVWKRRWIQPILFRHEILINLKYFPLDRCLFPNHCIFFYFPSDTKLNERRGSSNGYERDKRNKLCSKLFFPFHVLFKSGSDRFAFSRIPPSLNRPAGK